MAAIPSDQISVVIQGPLYRDLAPSGGVIACIASIRLHLPNSQIIISTWVHEDVSELEDCLVIQSEMPRALFNLVGNESNINGQIVSTITGIKAAERPYVLKLRADLRLTGTSFLRVGPYSDEVPDERKYLKCPVTITNLFVRNPARIAFLFHYSDLVQFGLTEDLSDLWDIPLVAQGEAFRFEAPVLNPFGQFLDGFCRREMPEQSLVIRWLRKHGTDIRLRHSCEVTSDLLRLSERTLVENFAVIDWASSEVQFPKRLLRNKRAVREIYTAAELAEIRENRSEDHARARALKVWINQYIVRCFQPGWYMTILAMLALKFSPVLLKKLRVLWQHRQRHACKQLRIAEAPTNGLSDTGVGPDL